MEPTFLLYLCIILLSTKFFGILFHKLKLPQVAGALVAGVIIGPMFLNLVQPTEFLVTVAELGVIVLMFLAGMEADMKELKKAGPACAVIAIFGVIVPLIGGFFVARIFLPLMGYTVASTSTMLQYVFIGVILTATSVSITVETLKELGKLSSPAGNAILGAAIIDDILGIIILTIITSLANPSGGSNVSDVMIKIVGFFIFTTVIGILFYFVLKRITSHVYKSQRRIMIISLSFCFFMSYAAEEYFGVADITGAFFAGLVISNLSRTTGYVSKRCETLSFSMLAPVFFASIGLKVTLPAMGATLIGFTIVIIIVAILTKMLGCFSASKLFHYTNQESMQICIGMISRGEVALIVANKGLSSGLIEQHLIGPIILMVIITTILAPILLKPVFNTKSC